MRRMLRRMARWMAITVGSVALLIALLATYGFARNYVHSETRGSVPLERLARRGSPLERSVARAIADSMAEYQYYRMDREWHARTERSADGDTLRVWLYRSQDARFTARFVNPDPHIVGGAAYIISERRLRMGGVGIR